MEKPRLTGLDSSESWLLSSLTASIDCCSCCCCCCGTSTSPSTCAGSTAPSDGENETVLPALLLLLLFCLPLPLPGRTTGTGISVRRACTGLRSGDVVLSRRSGSGSGSTSGWRRFAYAPFSFTPSCRGRRHSGRWSGIVAVGAEQSRHGARPVLARIGGHRRRERAEHGRDPSAAVATARTGPRVKDSTPAWTAPKAQCHSSCMT